MTKVGRFVYWTPRIVGILFFLFLMLFSLDVFGNGYGFWETIGALLMHNIPAFVLLVLLIVSWKREIVGAIAFTLAGFVYIGFMVWNTFRYQFEWYMIVWSLQIAGPAFFVGYLFYLNWKRKKK